MTDRMGGPKEVRSRVADAIARALPAGLYDDLVLRDLYNAADAALGVLNTARENRRATT